MWSKIGEKIGECVDYIAEHNIEFATGVFAITIFGIMVKYPDAFVEEAKEDTEKVVVEVHHYHHND